MKRVLIIGSPGSGKSTLATKLASQLDAPVIHLDQIYWLPGWKLRPKAEAYKDIAELASGEAWIMEGNWFHSMDLRMAHADAIVFIDLPAWLCIARVVRRILRTYGQVRSDMAADCPEGFDLEFLKYIWDYPKGGRLKALELIQSALEIVTVHHLKSRQEVESFLNNALPV